LTGSHGARSGTQNVGIPTIAQFIYGILGSALAFSRSVQMAFSWGIRHLTGAAAVYIESENAIRNICSFPLCLSARKISVNS
jgi:hypothetical protein